MGRLPSAFVALMFVGLVIADRSSYKGYSVISAKLKIQDHLDLMTTLENAYLSELEFLTRPSLLRKTDVMVSPQIKATIRNILNRTGIPFTVKIADVEKLAKETMMHRITGYARVATQFSKLMKQDYLSFEEIEKFLQGLSVTRQNVVALETIGKTLEGRNINMVTLSKKDGRQRPAIIMEALTHAREWITGAVILNLIQSLVDNAYNQENPDAYYMMDHFDWYIVPVHNPDGYAYSRRSTNTRMWRKNRNPNTGSTNCPGVDLNRNWDFKFIAEGTNDDPCSPLYSGRHAFSEIETHTFGSKMMALNSTARVLGFISLHAYSQSLLTPMAYSKDTPEMHGRSSHVLNGVAKKSVETLRKVYGTFFSYGTPKDTIGYSCSGTAYDYALARVGIPYAYTYELRDTGNYGFLLPADQIMPSFLETLASVRSIAEDIYNDKSVNPY